MQVNDDMLRAVGNIASLKAVDVGFSASCTRAGLLSLTRLTNLQCLSVTGRSAHDFGSLNAEDIAKLASMPKLAVLEVSIHPQIMVQSAVYAQNQQPVLVVVCSLDTDRHAQAGYPGGGHAPSNNGHS